METHIDFLEKHTHNPVAINRVRDAGQREHQGHCTRKSGVAKSGENVSRFRMSRMPAQTGNRVQRRGTKTAKRRKNRKKTRARQWATGQKYYLIRTSENNDKAKMSDNFNEDNQQPRQNDKFVSGFAKIVFRYDHTGTSVADRPELTCSRWSRLYHK